MNCRSCNVPVSRKLLSLGTIPFVNNLLAHPLEPYESGPLDLMYCEACSLGQLAEVVPGEKLFREYVFYSSVMAPVVKRAHDLASEVLYDSRPLTVIEIGSNDGYLLEFYRLAGVNVLGIDPARGPANRAARKGIPTIQEFFSLELAKTLPHADVIHANNVLAHSPDPNDIVAGFAQILKPLGGTCIVEVPYLGDLARNAQFDTVYHEHIFYFSEKSISQLFNRHGLYVKRIDHLPDVLGGSIRVFASKSHLQCGIEDYGLDELSTLQARANNNADRLNKELSAYKGKTIWGFGAAAKATVMLNYCGIDESVITAIADDTPAKQGKFIPGTGIQVRSTEDWLKAQPDVTCIFAWNYAETIMSRYVDKYTGKFITSLPLEQSEAMVARA